MAKKKGKVIKCPQGCEFKTTNEACMRGHLRFAHKEPEKEPAEPDKENAAIHHCPYTGCKYETTRIQALHGHIRFKHEERGEYLPSEELLAQAEPEPTVGLLADISRIVGLRIKMMDAERIYNDAMEYMMLQMSKDSKRKRELVKFVKELKLLERGGKK